LLAPRAKLRKRSARPSVHFRAAVFRGITGAISEISAVHDIAAIRKDSDAFARGLARRGLDGESIAFDVLQRDRDLRELQTRLQQMQARRNEASKLIGQAKAKKDEAQASALMAEVAGLKTDIQSGEEQERQKKAEIENILAGLPNLPAPDVPNGNDERDNVEAKERAFGSRPPMNSAREHFELGEALGMMDFERAAKVSGARFVYLTSGLARLERAIANFMLDLHTGEFGYTEFQPPILARDDAFFGTTQLPKFENDQFWAVSGEVLVDETDDLKTAIRSNRYGLIPTAEVTLTNYVREEILDEDSLPRRHTAWTPCFRAEAGAAGKDTRGMIRMHQFSKVELVSITTPEQSEAEHERMTDCAQEVLKRLDLHHRVMTLCTGDMGFAAKKTYDIEVWLPGQNRFREISSCSNCGDFQARRMNARYRPKNEKGTRFVHTLNGSGLAVGRTLIAIMENYQNPDGSIAIPDALKPYMGRLAKIEKH
jgi:seryl-tRNA synthetase